MLLVRQWKPRIPLSLFSAYENPLLISPPSPPPAAAFPRHLTPTHQSLSFLAQQLRGHSTPPVSTADQVPLNMCKRYMMSSGEHLGFQMDDGAAARYCEEAGVLLHTIKDFSRIFPGELWMFWPVWDRSRWKSKKTWKTSTQVFQALVVLGIVSDF